LFTLMGKHVPTIQNQAEDHMDKCPNCGIRLVEREGGVKACSKCPFLYRPVRLAKWTLRDSKGKPPFGKRFRSFILEVAAAFKHLAC